MARQAVGAEALAARVASHHAVNAAILHALSRRSFSSTAKRLIIRVTVVSKRATVNKQQSEAATQRRLTHPSLPRLSLHDEHEEQRSCAWERCSPSDELARRARECQPPHRQQQEQRQPCGAAQDSARCHRTQDRARQAWMHREQTRPCSSSSVCTRISTSAAAPSSREPTSDQARTCGCSSGTAPSTRGSSRWLAHCTCGCQPRCKHVSSQRLEQLARGLNLVFSLGKGADGG